MRNLKKLAPSSSLRLLSFRGTLQRLSVALLTLVMTLTAQTVWAETINGVSYIDENGATQTANNVTVLTGGEATTLQAGWYVVNSSNIKYTGTVTLDGDVNIILADDGKMNIDTSGSVDNVMGIYGTNSTLIIYGQASGTGELNVVTSNGYSDAILVDNLTINGGKITASASGPFSSVLSADKHITINGGIITATAGNFSLHAIFAADLTINGGKITATANGENACGLRATNNLTINSGVITATANGEDGSGLSATNNITINSGVITATATWDRAYGILAGYRVIINGGQVTARGSNYGINAGGISLSWKNTTDFIDANSYYLRGPKSALIIATGKAFTDGNGHNYTETNASAVVSLINTKLSPVQAYSVAFDSNGGSSVSDQVVLDGATVTVPTAPTKTDEVFCGWYMDSGLQAAYDFTSAVTGNLTLYAKWADAISYDMTYATVQRIYRYTGSAVTPVVRNNAAQLLTAGTDYTVSYTGATEMKQPGVYSLTVTGQGTYTGSQTVSVRVLAFDKYDGTSLVSSTLPANNSSAVVVSSTTTAMQSGCWYVVSEDAIVADRITLNGDVNLVLCDGATLTAEQGISVTDGNSLTIYSQSGNTGKLVASVPNADGSMYNAAIGGDRDDRAHNTGTPVKAGIINIHGGVINATAAYGAAGIGQAYGGDAGTINIYGGKITAGCGDGTVGTGIGGTGATVHLGWCRESDDFINSQGFWGTVVFDKAFAIDGTNFGVTLESIAGNKIVPTTKNFYTVTFQPNNGSTVDELCMLSGTTIPEPDMPLKARHQFAGWYDNVGFSGSAYDFTTAVDHSFTLYAKWDNVAPLSYIDADGHTVNDFTDYTPLENCYTELPEGTYFVGKNTTVSSRIELGGTVNLILGDGATLTAEKGIHVAEYNTLNIFVQSAGTGALTASVASGTAIGADFSDYSIGLRQAGTIRIYGGIITANTGAFSNAIGGTRGVGIGSGDIYIYGGTVTATAGEHGLAIGSASYEGGTISILGGKITANNSEGIGGLNDIIHLGWQNADDFILSSKYNGTITIDKSFVLESNDAIEANINNIAGKKIVPNTTSFYDVSFNTNGGNVIESQRIKSGGSAVQPAAVKQHHTFEGWYANEGCTGSAYDFTTAVDHSFTLYAKWKANYRVNYSKAGIGGISGIMTSQTLHVGEANQLAACAYSREGYTFIGWATTADGDAEYADVASVTSLTTTPGASVTLYAKWQANQYDISAPANFSVTVGGSTAATATIDQVVTLQVASGYSLQGTPMVIDDNSKTCAVSAAGNGSYTFTMPASNVHVEALVVESGWKFIGTYDTQNFSASNDDIYGFVGTAGTGTEVGSFVQVGGYVRVKPMRAYMQAPAPPNNARAYSGSSSDTAPGALRIRLLGSNGETTGIVSLAPDPSPKGEGSGYWYTLDGRKLQGKPTQKGLYINNGKKVVIK